MPHVRPAAPADCAAVAAIALEVHALHHAAHPDLFQPPSPAVATAESMAHLLAQPGHLLLVAVDDADAVVGYAHAETQVTPASPYKRAAALLHVHAMAVAGSHRGRGIGHALLAAVREAATARGCDGVSLEVYAFNAAARAFYEREGFLGLRERMELRP
ncbi:GNAT family N-acetyltransferase [Roseisolibacter agri]|uniref:N-acetyltransferase n=1 Tax=Roseisolibacter agri TaxID=2014610 RepID=A0AA37QGN9_9BACT|nr:GNAT family N-acetyltransferase [Roseisolibacter agri]GLC28551.1 N-acetyltransferase [Roseisolibacter agri]